MLDKHRKTAFVISVILVILWMAYIFSFSAAPAVESSQESGRITEKVVRIYEKDYDLLPEEEQKTVFSFVEGKIRKIAHFGLYAILGILVALSCFLCAENNSLKYVIGYLACFLYGASDELHQYFSPGRSPLVKDVFIDGSGSAVGMAFVLLAAWVIKSKFSKLLAK